jgi:hypothetical protein
VEPQTKLGLVNFGIGVEVIGDGSKELVAIHDKVKLKIFTEL